MNKNEKKLQIAAVIVTYNRKELLLECIDAILSQSYSLQKIIIVDNASTDGTRQALEEKGYLREPAVAYHVMEKNIGGAGGFCEGIKIAKEFSPDWIWVMDDDTIPRCNALQAMMEKAYKYPDTSFFASCVEGLSHEPMNVPVLDERRESNGYSSWYMTMNDQMVKIAMATFVSIMINSNAIQKCGLPCKDFFLWGDDSEYTTRLTRYFGPAYLVGNSWVCHKRVNASSLDICMEKNAGRIKNFHYLSRNVMIFSAKYDKKIVFIKKFLSYQLKSIKALASGCNGIEKFFQIQKGILEFFFCYRHFSHVIDSELSKGFHC